MPTVDDIALWPKPMSPGATLFVDFSDPNSETIAFVRLDGFNHRLHVIWTEDD